MLEDRGFGLIFSMFVYISPTGRSFSSFVAVRVSSSMVCLLSLGIFVSFVSAGYQTFVSNLDSRCRPVSQLTVIAIQVMCNVSESVTTHLAR